MKEDTRKEDRNGRKIHVGDTLFCISENYKGKVWKVAGGYDTDCRGWGDEPLSTIDSNDIEVIE